MLTIQYTINQRLLSQKMLTIYLASSKVQERGLHLSKINEEKRYKIISSQAGDLNAIYRLKAKLLALNFSCNANRKYSQYGTLTEN